MAYPYIDGESAKRLLQQLIVGAGADGIVGHIPIVTPYLKQYNLADLLGATNKATAKTCCAISIDYHMTY